MLALGLFIALSVASSAEAAPSLPEDARLAPVRQRLEETVGRAAAAGLPADVLVAKVREGLAKGVDPGRIEAAVGRLADSLAAAQRFVGERRPGKASGSLVRAVAEARLAGLALPALEALVPVEGPEPAAQRAVEVLTDLSLRGYPTERALPVVRDVLARDAGALERLPAALETIRKDHGLSHAEAADALARGLAGADSLQAAYGRAVEDERRSGNSRARDRGEAREAPGKSGVAPGHLPKGRPVGGGRRR